MNFEQAVEIASDKARLSNYHHQLGAVLLGAPVWSAGYNRVYGEQPRSIHAEDAATSKFRGTTLIVVRLGNNRVLKCSKPCGPCQKLLRRRGVKIVWFVNWAGSFEKMYL